MPQTITETVKIRDLCKDDAIVNFDGSATKIASLDKKVKWGTILLADDTKLRLELEDSIQVQREVPTPEEEAAQQLRHTLRSLDFKEANARKNLEHYREQMIKRMESGERADSWHWMDVPRAQAEVELWDAVAHVHRVRALSSEPLTRIQAVKLVLEARTKKALEFYRALSRSTSVISNLFDDIKIEALSEWRRELEWVITLED